MHALTPRGPAEALSPRFPLSLNTGRIRDHWHTMTRTALAPQLCRHTPEPMVDIHPADAEAAGVVDGALTCVETAQGTAIVLAQVTDRQRRGGLFMPMHWSDAYAPSGRANAATASALDLLSGQPEFKHTPARVQGYRETWRGFCISRTTLAAPNAPIVWRRIPQAEAQLYEFAGRGDADEREQVRRMLTKSARGVCICLEDVKAGSLREAYLDDDRLECVLFFGARLPPRDWLAAAFAAPVTEEVRKWLLHGRAPGATQAGPAICACAGVDARAIHAAITTGCRSVDAIGEATRAGLTCGSCRPELRRMLAAAAPAKETVHAE